MRELQAVTYDSKVYTDANILYKNGLIDQVTLSKNLTHLWGNDSDMFPLLSMTQAQDAFKSITPQELNDTQYVWPVMGRMKWTTPVVGLANTNLTTPGKNFSTFDMYVETNFIHYQYSAFTPDQKHIVRFMSEPKQESTKKYRVTVQLITSDPTEYISLDNFYQGKAWAMGATSVAGSLSDGTTSNRMFPGKLTNQFGWSRYSKPIAGNITNKVVNIEFDIEGGGKTSYWLPFEMKQWEMERRMIDEVDLWYSMYNRDDSGVIHLKDSETGELIPKGAGVKQQIVASGNYDTYATLTKAKFDSTVRSIFGNRVDNGPMEIVLYTGEGGAESFHYMLMNECKDYAVALGEKMISGGEYLTFGAYFNQYRLVDGKILTIRKTKMFDQGTLAQQDRENGRIYNGYPWASYNMVFMDHSKDDSGERNIQLVYEKGREEITGVYAGLTPLPDAWAVAASKGTVQRLGTTKDKASYEVMSSRGICIKNATTCFWLEMSL